MQGDSLINFNYAGINPYKEMNNQQYNSMNILVDNIIYRSREFCTGTQLQKLSNVLMEIMSNFELIQVREEVEHSDYKSDNANLLNKFIQAKSLEGCSPRTITAYSNTIDKFLEWVGKSLMDVSPEDIRAYLKYKMTVDDVSNGYADTILRYLRTCFKFLSDEGYVYLDPTVSIPKIKSQKKIKEPFTPLELENLREYLQKTGQKDVRLRNVGIFELLLSSGVRIQELVQLDKQDIDWTEKSFIVLGKGAKERKVYFNTKTKKVLQDYLKTRNDNKDPLFISIRNNRNDGRLTVGAIERMFRNAGKELKIKAYPHKFRRTFATNLLKKGMPLEQVQTLLGHSNIETTTIYAIVDDEQVQFNHRRLMD